MFEYYYHFFHLIENIVWILFLSLVIKKSETYKKKTKNFLNI